jgi:glucan biosynthesis protein C
LPFYILHQPVLLSIGYFIVTWEIPDALKWAIIATSSFIVILTIYLFLVRKIDLLRLLFGMKTIHPFWDTIIKRRTLISIHALYIGLIVLSVSGVAVNHSPMPLQYDPTNDILLNSKAISNRSPTGVHVVNDEGSIGHAIEFTSGANRSAEPNPKVFVEMHFSAPAGRYWIWLRGKSDVSNMADSVWLQVDDWIGTRTGDLRMGNWLDIYPVGVYAWAGDSDTPIAIELQYAGDHTIRIQPRQTPHRIDQIWLSRGQRRIPDILDPIRG